MPIEEQGWVVINSNGILILGTTYTNSERQSKLRAIQRFVPFDQAKTIESGWEYLEKEGYKCIKFKIVPIKE